MKRLLCAALVGTTFVLFIGRCAAPSEPHYFAYAVGQVSAARTPLAVQANEQAGNKKKDNKMKLPAWLRQCEYSWDCDAPLDCCEFMGSSFCCGGALGIPSFSPAPELIPIPIPVERGPPGPYGGNAPPGPYGW